MRNMDKAKETVPVDVAKTPETPFLVDLFNAFNGSNIDYCVLRNYSGLPYDLQGSDLDILLSEDSLDRARKLVAYTARNHNGFAVWREFNDYIRGYFFCSGIDHRGRRWGVHIDLMIAFRWHGLDYYSSHYVLSRAVTRHGVRVANACDANLTAFLDKVLTICSMHKDSYGQAAATAYAHLPYSRKEEIAAAFGVNVGFLAGVLATVEPKLLKNFALKLRRRLLINQMLRSPMKVLGNKLRRLRAHCDRLLKKLGIFVVVLGLDGSGKSTLIELVSREFESLTHTKTEVVHYRPHLLPPIAKLVGRASGQIGPVANPHASPPSGRIVSILRMAYCTVDYLLGYWLSVYPLLVRRATVVFFDRYYYDYYVDPVRYLINTRDWIVRFFEWFIPEPDLIIILVPDPEVFHKRKPEVPLEEAQRQANRMQKIGKTLKNVVWIDTSGPIDRSREEMLGAVLERLKEQLAWK